MPHVIRKNDYLYVEIDSNLSVLAEQYLSLVLTSAGLKKAGTLDVVVSNTSRVSSVVHSFQSHAVELGLSCDVQRVDTRLNFRFARDIDILSEVVLAFQKQDHYYIGDLLGFPRSAREWFCKDDCAGISRDRYLLSLVHEGVEVPLWVVFCPFVVPPSEVLVNGECAGVGEKYKEFAFSHETRLALGVRDNFYRHLYY